jgi:hypothetical protein
MNCEEYRQAIAADPSFDGGAGHLSECAGCQQYRAEMLSLDRRIGRALEIDVPKLVMPELDDIEADNVFALGRRRRLTVPTWLAMAATVAVAAIIGVRMVGLGVQYDSLADEVLAHLDHEPAALRVTDVAISDERLRRVVPAGVADMDHSAGLITYAQTCVINGHEVPHLVVQGAAGPITILLMPEEMVPEAVELQGENVNGVILPVGNGSIAIIGEPDEFIENMQERVIQSVTWTT